MEKLRYNQSFYLPLEQIKATAVPPQFMPEDFEYIRRQILDQRSLNSSNRTNTVTISLVYEAANTLLRSLEYIGKVCVYGIDILIFDSLSPNDAERYKDMFDNVNRHIDYAKPFVIIFAKCTQPEYDIELNRLVLVNGHIMCLFYYDVSQANYVFYQEFYACDVLTDYGGGTSGIMVDFRYENVIPLNPNGIAYYHENFPLPTLYRHDIQTRFIRCAIDRYRESIHQTGAHHDGGNKHVNPN